MGLKLVAKLVETFARREAFEFLTRKTRFVTRRSIGEYRFNHSAS